MDNMIQPHKYVMLTSFLKTRPNFWSKKQKLQRPCSLQGGTTLYNLYDFVQGCDHPLPDLWEGWWDVFVSVYAALQAVETIQTFHVQLNFELDQINR